MDDLTVFASQHGEQKHAARRVRILGAIHPMPHMLIHMHNRARRQRGHLITNRKRHTPRDCLHKNRVGRLMIRQHLAGQKRKKNQICTIP